MPGALAAFQSAIADRYAIQQRLGEGGMAIVFLAHDLRHDRAVAVKVLRPEIAAALGPERFLREIRFAADLTHPHIVPLFDSGAEALAGHPPLPYYVMPRIPGETLRDRIARDGALPVDTAVSIAREVGQALAYAHGHGIVHRDIKPANILLTGEEAMVADFGIARALDQAGESDRITDSGLTLGTPAYMAPEQTTGDVQLDGRADIYALGCVLYEMLGGSPPFTGATAAAVLARHRTDPPPPLRTLRPTVPPPLEAVVLRALAKTPADRFQSAAEFVRALSPGSGSFGAIEIEAHRERPRHRFLLGGGLVLVAAVAAAMHFMPERAEPASTVALGGAGAARELDAYRFAVAPFEFAPLVLDALARWDGVSLVDERQMAADGSGQGDSDRARAAAHGAGRLIRGQVERAGAEVRISAQLLDTRTGELLARHAVRAPAGGSPDSAVAALADELVLLAAGRPADAGLRSATRSLPARYALARGLRAVNAWDLRAAADDFSDAARLDPRFGQALLWDALARAWSGAPAAAWRSSAERAHALEAGLSPRERIVAAAAVAMSRDDMVTACAHWARLARDNPGDFIAWYGWGDCLSRDDTVLRDPASASGWRFRTSYHAALRAYQRALQLQPSVHEGLSAGGFEPVSTLFKLRPTSARFGRSATAGQARFLALPGWVADTLVFVPWPLSEFRTPPTLLEAVQHQRELFHEIATGWTTALPSSPTALVALAHAIELLGQPGARETIERARKLAATPTDSFRAASQLVWVRLRLAAPHDPAGVAAASALADTLLARSGEVPVDPLALASLAALRGRTGAAIAGISQPDVRLTLEVPPGLFPAAPRLLLHAALGSPADTLRRLEREVAEAIDRSIPPRDRAAAREAWIARAVTLAFPGVRLEGAEAGGDYLLAALRALARGDSTAARAMLAAGLGTSGPLAERPADALFPEAWLLAASGDTVAAVAWLDRLLGSLYGKAARAASDPVEAAALVQAMQLRADLAAATGDTVAANAWGTTVRILRAD